MSPAKKTSDRKSPSKTAAKTTTHRGRTTESEELVVTDGATWARKGAEAAKGRPLRVPSGNVCLVQRPDGMEYFLDQGTVPNALMPIIQRAVNGQETTPEELSKFAQENPDVIGSVIQLADVVTIRCVIEPKVHPVPLDEEGNKIPPHLRPEDDKLYVDYIDSEDRMFIFNYAVSGVTDVKGFRRELDESVDALRSVEAVDEGSI